MEEYIHVVVSLCRYLKRLALQTFLEKLMLTCNHVIVEKGVFSLVLLPPKTHVVFPSPS